MSSLTRNNHFVPVWYQQGFLAPGKGELCVFDKAPDYAIRLPNGDVKKVKRRNISKKGPYKFLRLTDLYTTQYFGVPNDAIERQLFGLIDDRGADAVAMFKEWPITEHFDFHTSIDRRHGDPNKHLIALIDYLDAQKIRTPKGLRLLEPIREVLESNESDVIHCWALDSRWSARCGSPNTAKLQTAVAFVTRAI